jgi:hypothetical protein
MKKGCVPIFVILVDLGQGIYLTLDYNLNKKKVMKESRMSLRKVEFSDKEKDDIRTLMKFMGIYCRENHDGEKTPFSFKLFDVQEIEKKEIFLCPECTRLLTYGLTMRVRCPHDPKPMCKKCESQCYQGDYKTKIREVMKFSGMYMVKHGRVDMLYHYFR